MPVDVPSENKMARPRCRRARGFAEPLDEFFYAALDHSSAGRSRASAALCLRPFAIRRGLLFQTVFSC
jgi:hypothetical protein